MKIRFNDEVEFKINDAMSKDDNVLSKINIYNGDVYDGVYMVCPIEQIDCLIADLNTLKQTIEKITGLLI